MLARFFRARFVGTILSLCILFAAITLIFTLGWLRTIAIFFTAVPILNGYYVYDGWQVYVKFQPPSRILLLLFGVKLVSFVAGLCIGYISVAVLFSVKPIPFAMTALVIGLLSIFVIPAMIHYTVGRMLAADRER